MMHNDDHARRANRLQHGTLDRYSISRLAGEQTNSEQGLVRLFALLINSLVRFA